MMDLSFLMQKFLKRHLDYSKPSLLAFSGGVDSAALLHLLLACRKNAFFELGIAHIDHGWRKESRTEAEAAARLAADHGLPFHLLRLDPAHLAGNLEAACREERLRFYAELCQGHGYQAVFLGHHLDDQAETVLKSILEGKGLLSCQGMKECSSVEGIALWRPLLAARKRDLSDWLDSQGIVPFIDETNMSNRFLRGRMRTEILPELAAAFGKEPVKPLGAIAAEAQELALFMETHMQPVLERLLRGGMGLFLELDKPGCLSLFEWKYVLRKICVAEGLPPPRDILHDAALSLKTLVPNHRYAFGNLTLFIDRGCLFVPERPLPVLPELGIPLEGCFAFGPWEVSVMAQEGRGEGNLCGWRNAYSGVIEASLPEGKYTIGKPELQAHYPGTSPLKEWWNKHKVPAFIRGLVPVIWKDGSLYHEFLSGKCVRKDGKMRIRLSLRSGKAHF